MAERSYIRVVSINADSATVWAILSEVWKWPTWTPTVTEVRPLGESRLAVGNVYEVSQPGVLKAKFTVETLAERRSFRWSSKSIGLRSSADHLIDGDQPHQCTVTLNFTIEGWAAGVAWPIASKKIRRFVDLEAECLKAAAEKGTSSSDSRR